MDGIVKTEAQMKRSYNAYLKWRKYWQERGYSLDEQMTPEEYTEFHVAQMLMGGDPNIARTIVHNELAYTGKGAQELSKIAKKIKYTEYDEDEYDIYDVQEAAERRRNLKLKYTKEQYSDWRNIISAPDREQVFLDLAAAEIDVDLWDYDEDTRVRLYSKSLKRFREKFEAESDKYKAVRAR